VDQLDHEHKPVIDADGKTKKIKHDAERKGQIAAHEFIYGDMSEKGFVAKEGSGVDTRGDKVYISTDARSRYEDYFKAAAKKARVEAKKERKKAIREGKDPSDIKQKVTYEYDSKKNTAILKYEYGQFEAKEGSLGDEMEVPVLEVEIVYDWEERIELDEKSKKKVWGLFLLDDKNMLGMVDREAIQWMAEKLGIDDQKDTDQINKELLEIKYRTLAVENGIAIKVTGPRGTKPKTIDQLRRELVGRGIELPDENFLDDQEFIERVFRHQSLIRFADQYRIDLKVPGESTEPDWVKYHLLNDDYLEQARESIARAWEMDTDRLNQLISNYTRNYRRMLSRLRRNKGDEPALRRLAESLNIDLKITDDQRKEKIAEAYQVDVKNFETLLQKYNQAYHSLRSASIEMVENPSAALGQPLYHMSGGLNTGFGQFNGADAAIIGAFYAAATQMTARRRANFTGKGPLIIDRWEKGVREAQQRIPLGFLKGSIVGMIFGGAASLLFTLIVFGTGYIGIGMFLGYLFGGAIYGNFEMRHYGGALGALYHNELSHDYAEGGHAGAVTLLNSLVQEATTPNLKDEVARAVTRWFQGVIPYWRHQFGPGVTMIDRWQMFMAQKMYINDMVLLTWMVGGFTALTFSGIADRLYPVIRLQEFSQNMTVIKIWADWGVRVTPGTISIVAAFYFFLWNSLIQVMRYKYKDPTFKKTLMGALAGSAVMTALVGGGVYWLVGVALIETLFLYGRHGHDLFFHFYGSR